MNPIELLFRLLLKFNAIQEDRYSALFDKATIWWASIQNPDDQNLTEFERKVQQEKTVEIQKNPMLIKFKKFSNEWYAQVLNAVLYIWLVRQIFDYMNPRNENIEE